MGRVVILKSREEAEIIKANGQILGKAHAEVAKMIEPGVNTKVLDKIAEEYILDQNAKASFKNYNGFPFTLCISVNDVVVHGFPSTRELKDGDIISIDGGVYKDGFHADSAYTYLVGEVNIKTKTLVSDTKKNMQARAGGSTK